MSNTVLKPWTRQSGAWSFQRWAAAAMLAAALLTRGSLQAQVKVTTLGGGSVKSPYAGYLDGNTLTTARFSGPAGLALDPSGSALFIADYTNNAIRLVSQVGSASNSITSTFASATNSGATAINHPLAMAVDGATNVYVLNHGSGNNGAVLHFGGVAMNSGTLVVYPVLASGLVNATAMTMDGFGNLYVTVNGNQVIRVTTNGVVTTLGTISQSGTALQGIALLDNGQLAVTDAGNNGIWLLNPVTGAAAKFTGFHGAADVLGASSVAAFNLRQPSRRPAAACWSWPITLTTR